MANIYPITEKERLLVGLLASRWHKALSFEVDGAWFKATADEATWETSREEIERLPSQQIDALARQALVTLSRTDAIWPPLRRDLQNRA